MIRGFIADGLCQLFFFWVCWLVAFQKGVFYLSFFWVKEKRQKLVSGEGYA